MPYVPWHRRPQQETRPNCSPNPNLALALARQPQKKSDEGQQLKLFTLCAAIVLTWIGGATLFFSCNQNWNPNPAYPYPIPRPRPRPLPRPYTPTPNPEPNPRYNENWPMAQSLFYAVDTGMSIGFGAVAGDGWPRSNQIRSVSRAPAAHRVPRRSAGDRGSYVRV